MTSRSPGTRIRMPRAEREAQMLAVAEQVFSTRGIQATTMDEIAELVGVTKPLIYDYFGSKEGALIGEASASVERIRQQTAKAFAEGLRTLPAFEALEPRRVTAMAEILIGGCERLAVWRSTHPGTTADEATDLVVTTIWDGLASVAGA